MSPRRSDAPGPIERVERAIAAIRQGRMVVLVDDEDRENEGDLCMAAVKITPEAPMSLRTILITPTDSATLKWSNPWSIR